MPGAELGPDLYLTDGRKLWWIARVDVDRRSVLLEDCSHPEMPLQEMPVADLTEEFVLVRRPVLVAP